VDAAGSRARRVGDGPTSGLEAEEHPGPPTAVDAAHHVARRTSARCDRFGRCAPDLPSVRPPLAREPRTPKGVRVGSHTGEQLVPNWFRGVVPVVGVGRERRRITGSRRRFRFPFEGWFPRWFPPV
jgi:hypothetical protein